MVLAAGSTPDRSAGARFVVLASAAAALAAAVTIGASPVPASTGAHNYDYCPPAKQLVEHSTHFHHRDLAPGIRLAETNLGHHGHRLRLSVLRVNLHNRHSKIAPLHHGISTRHHLTKLARRPHLRAATNATYFSFEYGAPTVPFIDRGGPVVLTRTHQRVAGIGVNGRAQDGDAWFVGRVSGVAGSHRLSAINSVAPPAGLSIYTPAWGRNRIPMPSLAQSLVVRAGRTQGPVSDRHHVPAHGALLVASTGDAVAWLDELQANRTATVRYHANTDAPRPFQQAYGTGTQTVATSDQVRSGLYCRADEISAARTDIAWTNHRRQLILATIAPTPGSSSHGVDENQMSQVMVGIGADRSYALDGGGSTELVARLPHHKGMSVRTPRRSGHQRAIPLGIGVYSVPVPHRHHSHGKHHHHKNKHHHHHSSGPPRHHCLVGELLCH